jgi:hypothetical protein
VPTKKDEVKVNEEENEGEPWNSDVSAGRGTCGIHGLIAHTSYLLLFALYRAYLEGTRCHGCRSCDGGQPTILLVRAEIECRSLFATLEDVCT